MLTSASLPEMIRDWIFPIRSYPVFEKRYQYLRGRKPMAREPDVALLMTASGLLDIFLTRLLLLNFFSVIFHLPEYKAISNTM